MPGGPGGPRAPMGPLRQNSQVGITQRGKSMISVSSRVLLRSVQALRAHQGVRCVPELPVQGQDEHVQITGEWNGAFVMSVMPQRA